MVLKLSEADLFLRPEYYKDPGLLHFALNSTNCLHNISHGISFNKFLHAVVMLNDKQEIITPSLPNKDILKNFADYFKLFFLLKHWRNVVYLAETLKVQHLFMPKLINRDIPKESLEFVKELLSGVVETHKVDDDKHHHFQKFYFSNFLETFKTLDPANFELRNTRISKYVFSGEALRQLFCENFRNIYREEHAKCDQPFNDYWQEKIKNYNGVQSLLTKQAEKVLIFESCPIDSESASFTIHDFALSITMCQVVTSFFRKMNAEVTTPFAGNPATKFDANTYLGIPTEIWKPFFKEHLTSYYHSVKKLLFNKSTLTDFIKLPNRDVLPLKSNYCSNDILDLLTITANSEFFMPSA